MPIKAIKLRDDDYWNVRRLALDAKMNLCDYVGFLINSELARQAHPGVLIDTPVQYSPINTTGDVDREALYAPHNTNDGDHDQPTKYGTPEQIAELLVTLGEVLNPEEVTP